MRNFETERLKVTHWAAELDAPERRADLLAALQGVLTPGVLQHLPPPLHPDPGVDGLAAWVAEREAESAVYTVRLKTAATLLGLIILAEMTEDDARHVHVGYFLGESAWGHGFGSELLRGLVAAYARGPAVTLLGGVAQDNPASARVLEKAGFQRDAALSSDGTDMYVQRVGG